jgi:DNA (cytosine-5)-methyltransferase 1
VDNSKELPTVISFCSGYGGIERGLDLVGVKHRVMCYVEIEAYAIANLVAKMESGELAPAPVWTNLKTFPAHLFSDRTSIITGGYPCQPFSAAGKRQGADDPRHLWPYIRQHIQTIRPERTFFENVEGHISLGLSTVISDLEEDGYRTAWGLFSAEEVGAPHRRKRVFIMGNAKHDGSPATAQRRSNLQNGNNDTQGQDKAIQFTGTSEPRSNGNIQTSELSNTKAKRLQGGAVSRTNISQRQESNDQQLARCNQLHGQVFPARPNQEQHRWEHSRVEPKLGGKSNGYSNRVDRLRLLGNGVVPQTAALAWDTLSKRFDNP